MSKEAFAKLLELERTLRAPGGCPWDAEQTIETLKPNLLEETYEVLEAHSSGDVEEFREELGDLTAESFGDRVLSIAREAVDLRSLPLFTTQQVTLRSLVNPRHWPDTRVFLREAVFGFGGALQTFEHDPALYGLRLAFPPNPSTPHAFQLRMESYQSDPRSLFLEITGNFPPIPREGIDTVSSNVVSTYAFLTEHVLPFVACFDARQPS